MHKAGIETGEDLKEKIDRTVFKDFDTDGDYKLYLAREMDKFKPKTTRNYNDGTESARSGGTYRSGTIGGTSKKDNESMGSARASKLDGDGQQDDQMSEEDDPQFKTQDEIEKEEREWKYKDFKTNQPYDPA